MITHAYDTLKARPILIFDDFGRLVWNNRKSLFIGWVLPEEFEGEICVGDILALNNSAIQIVRIMRNTIIYVAYHEVTERDDLVAGSQLTTVRIFGCKLFDEDGVV